MVVGLAFFMAWFGALWLAAIKPRPLGFPKPLLILFLVFGSGFAGFLYYWHHRLSGRPHDRPDVLKT
jgi:sterol desaturase/sphingolipid hydroxylase (fatty acid hydroxylase superfamily)